MYAHPAVRVWTHDLQDITFSPSGWIKILNEEELQHFRKFRQEKDRVAYIAAHALLRCALAQRLSVPPASLTFERDRRGKPVLRIPENRKIDFSLSHTDGMVAVALSEKGSVGVDIEVIDHRNIPQDDLQAYGMTSEEMMQLALLPEPERDALFIGLWTAREAVAKAEGRGVSLPFSLITVDLSHNKATIHEQENAPATYWQLWRENPSSRHCICVAWPLDSGECHVMREQLL